MESVICPKCGRENSIKDKFCTGCGTDLSTIQQNLNFKQESLNTQSQSLNKGKVFPKYFKEAAKRGENLVSGLRVISWIVLISFEILGFVGIISCVTKSGNDYVESVGLLKYYYISRPIIIMLAGIIIFFVLMFLASMGENIIAIRQYTFEEKESIINSLQIVNPFEIKEAIKGNIEKENC